MMTKEVPAESDVAVFNNQVDTLFKRIYDENPKYWKNGLTRDLFYGIGDRLNLIFDTERKVKDPIGFVGFQKFRRDNNNKLVNAISVGLLPEYRGKGIAKKYIKELIPQYMEDTPYIDLLWTCNKNNEPSQRLFSALYNDLSKKYNFRLQFDKE